MRREGNVRGARREGKKGTKRKLKFWVCHYRCSPAHMLVKCLQDTL